MESLNIRRVSKRLHEIYLEKIDLKDVKISNQYCFETRALAATALMIKCGLNEELSALNITDGYHDLGLDAIYLDENQKTLFVVQSKWRNNGEGSITASEIASFTLGIKRILNFELEGANEKVMAKKTEIDTAISSMGYKVEAVFIHTGNSNMNSFVIKPMNDLIKDVNDDAGDNLHFSQISFKDVYNYLANIEVFENIKIDDVVLNNWGKIERPYLSYYGMISAVAIGEWFKQYGNKLFAKNLRFYKGRTEVNEGIRKVLMDEPENFFYYNNGIKLLCQRIIRKAKNSTNNTTGIFTLEGVSLINGAQTTGSIGSIYFEEPNKLKDANVMIQMIDMSNMPESVSKLITKLSNTQNRIENKDFAAQDPVQDKIKRELTFSHIQYLYKTGEEISDLSKQISFDEAIVALACLWKDVSYSTIAKRNVGALSEDISKVPYKALFNESTNAFEMYNAIIAIRIIEKYLQKDKKIYIGKEYLTCIHGNRLIEHIVLQEIKKDEKFSDSIMKEDDIGEKYFKMVKKIINIISGELENTYCDSYPANIFKNQSKTKAIAEVVERIIG